MQANRTLETLEPKSDADIALAIHYLDPEFHPEGNKEDDGAVLQFVVSSATWLTGTLTHICLYIRAL